MPLYFFLFPAAIITGAIAALMAAYKGKSIRKWFLIGFFLSLIGIAVLLYSARRDRRDVDYSRYEGDYD